MTKNNKKSNSDDEIQSYLKTDQKTGLTNQEVLERRNKFGKNILIKSKKESFFVSFLKTLIFEMMSLLLLVTGLIGLALAIYENIRNSSNYIIAYVEAGILLSIDLINALFGTIQERKSSNAIDELEKITSPTTKVLREGVVQQIDSSEVVIGDIIIVEAGDTISADAILFFDSHLKVSEAILTGESSEVLKDADAKSDNNASIGDQKNKIFSGTSVLNGKGFGIVYAIGNSTEIGKIANLLKESVSQLSPLQLKLEKLGKTLGIFGIALTIISFLFSLFVIENVITNPNIVEALQSSLLLAISLAAIAIPEGLAAIVTIVLAIGVKKMTLKNALIKKLPSVETLGSTSVICSDKTGTLTLNKMKIVRLWEPSDKNENNLTNLSNAKRDLIIKATLCNDAVIDENFQEKKNVIGDPTEIAILDFALDSKMSISNIRQNYKRIGEIPFDSERMMMSTINVIDQKQILIVKGAPDVIISKCKNLKNKDEIITINNKWTNSAIRVLAVAQKEIKNKISDDLKPSEYEYDLTFVGLIGMVDPPREEVKLSIKECKSAGIKPIMITGDHLNTAKSIAIDLGIISDETKHLAITGAELDKMSDEEFYKNIEKYSVYARVSPENKIRIVKAWQSKDQVVAMTGDGINDAPALKAADIGCAMGINGTDVSKQASDMIIMDDNFLTIVEAVKLGRNIYENIRRMVVFLLSSNITGIFAILFGMISFYLVFEIGGWGKIKPEELILLGTNENMANSLANELNEKIRFQTIITTILILIHHMIIETFPGVALGVQFVTTNLMNKRPISKYESIFARGLIRQILSSGLLHGVLTIIAFILAYHVALTTNAPILRFNYGIIATFITLTVGGILKSIVMCSTQPVWKQKWKECKWIYYTSILSFVIVLIVILIPKLTFICVEQPSLDINEFQTKIDEIQFEKIILTLSDNRDENSFAHWSIYVIGFGFGFLTFICLEILKYLENHFKKENKEKIIDFELIKKPKSFNWKKFFSIN